MSTKSILLINSEPRIAEVVQDCLSHLGGWHVFMAESPSEGLHRAIQEQPDAIVFDLSTFGMNFFTFLKRLRAQPATQTIPVVLIAAGIKWLNLEPLQQFHLSGVIDYSVDPTRLPEQIAQLLQWDEQPSWIEAEDYQ